MCWGFWPCVLGSSLSSGCLRWAHPSRALVPVLSASPAWGGPVGTGACNPSQHPRSQSRSCCVLVGWGWGLLVLQAFPASSQRKCSEAQLCTWPLERWPHQAEISSSDQLSNTLSYLLCHLPCTELP